MLIFSQLRGRSQLSTLKHLKVPIWVGGRGGSENEYALYEHINVDNCERPLNGGNLREQNHISANTDLFTNTFKGIVDFPNDW